MMDMLIKIMSILGITRIIKVVLRSIAEKGCTWPFVFISTKIIQEVKTKDENASKYKPTILVLISSKFRGDEIEMLSGRFRVLKMPFEWQALILQIFWPSKIDYDWGKYFSAEDNVNSIDDNDRSMFKSQKDLRVFLKSFLSSLFKQLSIDCVLGAAFYYRQDYDWGLVSEELGVPYIIIQSDRITGASDMDYVINKKIKRCHKFVGSHIIVQDNLSKEALIKAGYIRPDKVSFLGLPRMDGFVKKVKQSNKSYFNRKIDNRRPKVTLFSFIPVCGGIKLKYGLRGNFQEQREVGYQKLFENVHVAITRLAEQNREIEFVIKTKWKGTWLDNIENMCKRSGYDVNNINNLTITDSIDTHQLIFDSDVICAFSSTTLLEAGIAGKPVIVPLFDEALKPEYQKSLSFYECYQLFDCAGSMSEFENLILKRINDPGQKVAKEFMEKKYEMFEKYISSMEGNSSDKYIELVSHIIECNKGINNDLQ